MFNRIFTSDEYPRALTHNIICPIHKSESINNVNNYRGISLSNVIYKIFATILSSRLCKLSETNQTINEAQAGFRNRYCTTDDMFTLHALIQKYLSKKKGRLYVLFIDFENAFDNICHKTLFESLSSI